MSINELHFLYIASWDYAHMERYLLGWIRRYGIKGAMKMAMNFRKNLQQALAKFAESNKMDVDTQIHAMALIETIYRIMGREYVGWARKEIIKQKPWMAKFPQKVKNLSNGWWNRYVKSHDGAY
jgi:hypothetical protein